MKFQRGKVGAFFPILILAYWTSLLPGSFCQQPLVLNLKTVQTFQNRHDSGFLTAIGVQSRNPPVTSELWGNLKSQKWKGVKAYFSTSYQLRPVSNQQRLLEVNTLTGLTYQDTVGMGLWDSEYWQMLHLGGGSYIIKNYKTGNCLTSTGLGEPVAVELCNSGRRQQWTVRDRK
ncbi:unnamed protein product [Allacma fusca]|uniref:Ricin B lectin domain-containing protein n=1 Tax=Allacma fusca TaxID=39272 RepID=A0A8J2P5Q7_9HEXA|nr:unnamed protein product [Allacma fusca]